MTTNNLKDSGDLELSKIFDKALHTEVECVVLSTDVSGDYIKIYEKQDDYSRGMPVLLILDRVHIIFFKRLLTDKINLEINDITFSVRFYIEGLPQSYTIRLGASVEGTMHLTNAVLVNVPIILSVILKNNS
jgi:hypothetical protein